MEGKKTQDIAWIESARNGKVKQILKITIKLNVCIM